MLTMLSPYLVKLVTCDVILVLLVFSVTRRQLRCGGKFFWYLCAQIILDHNSKRTTETGVQL